MKDSSAEEEPTFHFLKDPFPQDDLSRFHIEHNPMDMPKRTRKEIAQAITKRASNRKVYQKVKSHRMALYKPENVDTFGFDADVEAFDEIYSRLLGSYESNLETGSGPIDKTPRKVFSKKSMGLPKTVLLSATERRLGVMRKNNS